MTASTSGPAVSVVVIAHSVRHELERCFASIDAHAGMPVETILVDNASADDTLAWTAREHPQVVRVALDTNLGLAARDHGLRRARAPLTMFLDSDAELTAGALPAMVAGLEANADWGLVGPRLVYEDGSLQLSCRRFPPPLLPLMRRPPLARFLEDSPAVRRHLMADDDHGHARPVVYVLGACQLFRSELARAAGPFSNHFFWPDDADWCIRIRDAGGEIVYLPAATVVHSYRRLSSRRPVSREAWRHLRGFAVFQWQYRRRRREFERLADDLDRRAERWRARRIAVAGEPS